MALIVTTATTSPAPPQEEKPLLLELRGIAKHFPGVLALDAVDFDVRAGEVHILLGENGAGKSTLIKILGGVYPPDAGQLIFKGQPARFENPGDAQRAGISVIYQEPNLIPAMTVAENINLGNEPRRGPWFGIDEERLIANTLALFDRLNLALDPYSPVAVLSLAEQQMVAIARALHLAADLVIMDEPTAMLSQPEVSQLFSVIRSLRSQGIGILYVTHRLEETMQIGDRTTILRDGRKIATLAINETTRADLIRMIVGRPADDEFTRTRTPGGPEILRLEGISTESGIQDVTLSVHAGEILGITGLVGSGGTALLAAVFGAAPISSGAIYLDGQPVRIASPQDAISHGIGLVTEDRQEQGLVLEMNAQENMTLATLEELNPGPVINEQVEENVVQHYARRLNIRPDNLARQALFLSGGTQQKVVLSRWLASQCRVLLLDEPSRGIDVGARAELYRLMNDLARRGSGLVVVSANLQEIMGLADRIAVLRGGRLVGIVNRDETSPAEIMALENTGALP